jgi:hypothetical protein
LSLKKYATKVGNRREDERDDQAVLPEERADHRIRRGHQAEQDGGLEVVVNLLITPLNARERGRFAGSRNVVRNWNR